MAQRGWWGGKVIITLPSDDQKRHKNWCEYYEKEDKRCTFRVTKCGGSMQCEYYKKKAGVGPIESSIVPADVPVIHVTDVPSHDTDGTATPQKKTLADLIPGHTPAFGEKLLGKVVLIKKPSKVEIGEVVDENHDYIIIEKDNGKIAKFDRKMTIHLKILWVLDDLSEE